MTKKLLTLLLLLCVTSALHAANYLTFTAEADSSSFGIINKGSNNPNVQYSLDKGKLWMTLDTNTVVTLAKKGDMALLKGNNPSGFSHGRHIYTSFTMTGSIAASGSVMSLIDNKGDSKVIPCKWCFNRLFAECTSLVKAPSLYCTNINNRCYKRMFKGCTSLEQAPELPATELYADCYTEMFDSCISLKEAPELPATEFSEYCYTRMFKDCINLCSIKVCFDSWYRYHQTMLDCFNPSSTDGWLSNVAPTGTFICPESLIELFEEDKIPIGWRMMHTEE